MDTDCPKLVFAGPVGAGKTSAIRSLSDSEPVSTEMPMEEGAMGHKSTTTVALDFSPVVFNDGTSLHLYGLPGQDRFAHMRPIILQGAIGAVILLRGDSDRIASECLAWIQAIRDDSIDTRLAIGITCTDLAPTFRMTEVRETLRQHAASIPAFTIDARDRGQVSHLVRALLLTLD